MEYEGDYRERDRSLHPPALFPDYKTSIGRSPRHAPLSIDQSLSEITGPIFGPELLDPLDNDLSLNARVDRDPLGERIIVHGRVLGENERPVPNALLEIWQCNAAGRSRVITDQDGWCRFRTRGSLTASRRLGSGQELAARHARLSPRHRPPSPSPDAHGKQAAG